MDVRTTSKTVILPTAATVLGRLVTIKDKYSNAFVNNVLIQPQSGDTIDGSNGTYILSNVGAAVSLVSDGANGWMTLNSPATPFTGSTIYLSAATVNVAAVRLIDEGTNALSNLTASNGVLYLNSNAVFSGQLPLLSTIQMNFCNAAGSNLTVSSIFASNISVNAISANIIAANTFVGDGSRLFNIIPASTTVMQGAYSMFTVSSGTDYTGATWGTQLLSLSTLATQAAPLLLSNDGFTLLPGNSTNQMYRISYMTGGNQLTTGTVRPTLTMGISTAAGQVYYPSVENFEGGGGTVTLLETLNSTSQIQFFTRGLSNYTFAEVDATLYRMSFETVTGTGTNIFSTINVWGALNRFAAPVQMDATLTVAGATEVQQLNASNAILARNTLTVQGATTTNGITDSGGITALSMTALYSTVAASMYTGNLRATSTVIVGCNSVTIGNDNVAASNVTVSSLTMYDQSTMTYKPMFISSGAIFVGGVLASAAGGGGSGAGGSTISSLFVGSSSNENFIKFWGRVGEYNNTVIAEQSTGTTTSELLVFKGSSISDQIRMQTTGSIKFETGVPTNRNFITETALTTPTMTITASSNVGINTNNPQFNLDVAGTARFQTLMSTSAVYTGALYMSLFFA